MVDWRQKKLGEVYGGVSAIMGTIESSEEKKTIRSKGNRPMNELGRMEKRMEAQSNRMQAGKDAETHERLIGGEIIYKN